MEDKSPNYTIEKGVLVHINSDLEEVIIYPPVEAVASDINVSKNLKRLSLPDTMVYIGVEAFKGSNLEELSFHSDTFHPDTSISFPAKVKRSVPLKIDEEAFAECKNLKIASLPDNVSIEQDAFNGCCSLEEVTFGKHTLVKEDAFACCSDLKKANLENLVFIGSFAFIGCGLKEANLTGLDPKNYILNENIFIKNENLEKVILPPTVNVIAKNAFTSCYSLKEINLENVNMIGEDALMGTGLEALHFEGTIHGNASLAYCTNLRNLNLKIPKFKTNLIVNDNNIEDLYINTDEIIFNGHGTELDIGNMVIGPDLKILTHKPFTSCNIDTLNFVKTKHVLLLSEEFDRSSIKTLVLAKDMDVFPEELFKNAYIENLIITSPDLSVHPNFASTWTDIKKIVFTSDNFTIKEADLFNLIKTGVRSIYFNDEFLSSPKTKTMFLNVENQLLNLSGFPCNISKMAKPLSEYFNAKGFRLRNKIDISINER